MELKDRIKIILNEKKIKQRMFAESIKVTESYVSNLLSGKRTGMSEPLASLIEELYGYSAKWVLSEEGEKYSKLSNNPELTPSQKSLIIELEQMSDDELIAVKSFIDTMKSFKSS